MGLSSNECELQHTTQPRISLLSCDRYFLPDLTRREWRALFAPRPDEARRTPPEITPFFGSAPAHTPRSCWPRPDISKGLRAARCVVSPSNAMLHVSAIEDARMSPMSKTLHKKTAKKNPADGRSWGARKGSVFLSDKPPQTSPGETSES
jgi:hypothetical protein